MRRMPTLRQLGTTPLTQRAGAGARTRAHRTTSSAWPHVAGQFAQMEYGFLYDRARHLLSIGYNVDERRLDAGYYDLLASEARLCSFVAIAQGQLPQESWFALGRLLTEVDGDADAAVVERLDVRVPDAAAGDAELSGHAARPDLRSMRWQRQIAVSARSATCRGAFPNPATTPSMRA